MELLQLRVNYPHPARSVDELKILTKIWLEDFENVADDQLQSAIRQHRRHSPFFPTVADLMDLMPPPRSVKLLPDEPVMDAQNVEENQQRLKELVKSVFH